LCLKAGNPQKWAGIKPIAGGDQKSEETLSVARDPVGKKVLKPERARGKVLGALGLWGKKERLTLVRGYELSRDGGGRPMLGRR